jgi:hypothetical protein
MVCVSLTFFFASRDDAFLFGIKAEKISRLRPELRPTWTFNSPWESRFPLRARSIRPVATPRSTQISTQCGTPTNLIWQYVCALFQLCLSCDLESRASGWSLFLPKRKSHRPSQQVTVTTSKQVGSVLLSFSAQLRVSMQCLWTSRGAYARVSLNLVCIPSSCHAMCHSQTWAVTMALNRRTRYFLVVQRGRWWCWRW